MTAPEDFRTFFQGKIVTLMGLGLLGRGVGDAAFLARHCKKVYVTDGKDRAALQTSVDALQEYKNIEFALGGHSYEHFAGVDFVIKAAGVRLDNPYIEHARKNNVPVYMSTALFARFCAMKTVGATGTRGKTSVTCMIADILKRAGKRVLLGGNIRGVSTLSFLERLSEFDIAALELDSWQLQGFDDLNLSPNIGVFTTFYPDHMNYYDGDMKRYLRDKASVFMHQKNGDCLVASPNVADILRNEFGAAEAIKSMTVASPLPSSFELKTPGAHNLLNAGLAKAAALACGVDEKTADAALRDFESVEGRLQLVGKWQGRAIYNDNNATTQDATLAALGSFPPASVVLIFGGADKGLPIDELLQYISDNKIRGCLIKGTGSDRVLKTFPEMPVVSSMKDAVDKACAMSKPGDNIILSPAFASFGLFNNEYERSDQFISETGKLITKNGAVN